MYIVINYLKVVRVKLHVQIFIELENKKWWFKSFSFKNFVQQKYYKILILRVGTFIEKQFFKKSREIIFFRKSSKSGHFSAVKRNKAYKKNVWQK